jgi:uncharacterized repeat protein (TIGR02543 family)
MFHAITYILGLANKHTKKDKHMNNKLKTSPYKSHNLHKKLIVITLSIILLGSSLLIGGLATAAPTGVTGRTLPPNLTGDTSDWIEIATSGGYSLILRKENLPNSQIPFSNNYVTYPTSNARTFVNNWFKNTLNPNAPLRDFTVQNDALNNLGAFGSTGSGLSNPSSTAARTGDDVAFLLSFAEASLYCSKQYATSTTNWVSSHSVAQSNYGKLIIPSGQQNDFWWLRSPGATGTSTSSVGSHSVPMADLVYQSSTIGGYPYIRPALWVKSSVFDYSITYELDGGNNAISNPTSYDTGALPLSIANPTKPGYTFIGWTIRYASSGGTIIVTPTTPCAIPTGTAGNIIITANWQQTAVSYTVHYYLENTTTSVYPDKVVTNQTMGTWVTEYAVSVTGYTPNYPYSTGGVLNATNNIFVLYYSTDPVSYTVHYYLDGTTTSVYPDKIVSDQTLGSWVMEYAVGVMGYTPHYPYFTSGALNATGNVFVLYYSANTNIEYVVHYYLEGTSTKVADSKNMTGQTMGSLAIELPVSVVGYTANYPYVFGMLNATGNVFVFYYSANTNIVYTVHYYLENTTTKVADSKNMTGQTMGASIAENATDIAGYTAVAPTSITAVLNATDNVLVFYYSINADISYTVHYYLEDTTTKITGSKNVTGQVLGSWVTENATGVAGYTAVAPTSITAVLNATDNVLVFYYSANTDITYAVYYYLKDTTVAIHFPKVVTNQTMGAFVTEDAVYVLGYIPIYPSVSGVLNATGNVFVIYYEEDDIGKK